VRGIKLIINELIRISYSVVSRKTSEIWNLVCMSHNGKWKTAKCEPLRPSFGGDARAHTCNWRKRKLSTWLKIIDGKKKLSSIHLSDAISIEKRYFTSDLSILS
jgi:hypothetical protein